MARFPIGEYNRLMSEFRARVPELIRERLYNKGTYADGRPIITYRAVRPNVYAWKTIKEKAKANQPYDRVTLRDTGRFYSSIKMTKSGIVGNIGKFSENVDTDNILDITEDEAAAFEEEYARRISELVVKADVLRDT